MTLNKDAVLFALALEKPVEKRAAFLAVISEGNAALRARLEALPAAHGQPDARLASHHHFPGSQRLGSGGQAVASPDRGQWIHLHGQ